MTEQDAIRMTNEVFVDSFEIPKEKLVPEANIFNDFLDHSLAQYRAD